MMNPLNLIKKILSSRVGLVVVAFIVGGAVAAIFAPEKTIIKKEIEEKIVEKIVEKEVVKWKTKTVIKDKIVEKEVKKTKTKITYPDGKIIETEVYESNTQQVERLKSIEEEKYKLALVEKDKEYLKKEAYLKEVLNPHKFHIFAGALTQIDDPKNYGYVGGMDAQIWGPFTIGGQVSSRKDVGLTFGIRF